MRNRILLILVMVLCAAFLINGCFFNDDDSAKAGASNEPRFIIEGTLPVISDGAVSAPGRAADFGSSSKYSIGLYRVNGSAEGSEI